MSQALREYTYPFFAVIVLRQNKMTIVARLEGPIEPEILIAELRRIMADNEASLIVTRAERWVISLFSSLPDIDADTRLTSSSP